LFRRRTTAAAYSGRTAVEQEPAVQQRPARRLQGQPIAAAPNAVPVADEPRPGVAVSGRRAIGGLSFALARLIILAAEIVAAVIVLGIAFVVLGANPANTVVSHVHDWARTLTGPFDGMFSFSSHTVTIAVNWGAAVVVYLLAAALITSPLRDIAAWRVRPWTRSYS
jgi:hypothetical protein